MARTPILLFACSCRRRTANLFSARSYFFFPELLAVVSQVVPDVAPGFNVPAFYEDFVRERREMVNQRLARRQPPGPQPPTSPPQQQQQRGGGAVPIG